MNRYQHYLSARYKTCTLPYLQCGIPAAPHTIAANYAEGCYI